MMETSETRDDSRFCDNCQQSISESNWVMHEARCRRINMLCPECKEVVLKDHLEEHREEYHTMEPCDLCSKPVQRWLLDKHKSDECWKRCIVCAYCKTEVALADFSEHEHACGSRTDECYVCHRYIMLKDMTDHLWKEHQEGSGPVVPHNSPTHKRKGASNGTSRESPVALTNPLYGRKVGVVSRKMGVSQPAREKKKVQVEDNLNSLNQQFGQLSLFEDEVVQSPPPLETEGSRLMYRERVSPTFHSTTAPPGVPAGQQQQQEKNGGEGEEDPNTIPCEACGKNIPIPDFINHEQSCDPWAFFQAPSTPPTSDPSKWEEQQQLSPTLPIHSQVYTNSSSLGSGGNVLPSYEHRYSAGPTSQEDSVLCDDCDRYIPFTQWESHKANCLSSWQQEKFSSHVQGRTNSPPVLGDVEQTLLPCQFCGQVFAKSALQQHQERCMAETQTFSQNDMSAWESSTSPPLHTAQDLLCEIPCEYCNNSVAASMLSEHQATCDENPLVKLERQRHGRQGTRDSAVGDRRGDSGRMRQCQYCHESFTAEVLKNHKILCPEKPRHSQAKRAAVTSGSHKRTEPPGDTSRGCYYCGLTYPLGRISRHEDECLKNPKNTPSSRYEEGLGFEGRTPFCYGADTSYPAGKPWLQEGQRRPLFEGRVSPPSSSVGIPCEYCAESFAIEHVYSHQVSCPRNPDLQVDMPALEPLHSDTDESICLIPCEFCDKQLSLSQIHSHQVQCEVMFRKEQA